MPTLISLVLKILNRLARVEEQNRQLLTGSARIEEALQSANARLEQILEQIIPGPAQSIIFTIEQGGRIITGENHVDFSITDNQTQQVQVTPGNDSKGNPGTFTGTPTWASSDPTIATVTPAADGLTAAVAAVGPLGTVTVTVTATAGSGTVSGTATVTVTGAPAASLEITPVGPPTEQTA